MWLTPQSYKSNSTIYISSATPVSSRIHSFPTTPVKAPPRDLQSENTHKAAEFKAQGNACFENKKYTEAIELYSMAKSYVPSDYVSFSNDVISSLPQRQPSSLLPLAKQKLHVLSKIVFVPFTWIRNSRGDSAEWKSAISSLATSKMRVLCTWKA